MALGDQMNERFALIGPEWGPFLYSSVGEQRDGMPLSVLSALARHNLDPWAEAAELAALPFDIARKRLASLVEGLPGIAGRLDAGNTADRLMLLLPKRTVSDVSKSPNVPAGGRPAKSSIGIWLIIMGLMIIMQIISSILQPPVPTAQDKAPTAKVLKTTTAPSSPAR